jgi:hypothetical protein
VELVGTSLLGSDKQTNDDTIRECGKMEEAVNLSGSFSNRCAGFPTTSVGRRRFASATIEW